jgi:septal ring factor EnvC (AmiA/AmiB activator)
MTDEYTDEECIWIENEAMYSQIKRLRVEVAKLRCELANERLRIAHFGRVMDTANATIERLEKQEPSNARLRAEVERLTNLMRDLWEVQEAGKLVFAAMEKAQAEVERLAEAHERIVDWSRAFPLTVFPTPDLKRARELLEAGGMTLDAISADAMRHVIEQVAKISGAAIKEKADTP